jgi:O-antigen ligase
LGGRKIHDLTSLASRSSLSSRETIWQVSLDLIKQHPIAGIGPGNFQKEYLALQTFYPAYLEWAVPQPHNIFLAFWLQSGMIGFFGFMLVLAFVFQTLLRSIKDKKNALLAASLLVYFIYTILHGLVDTPYWKNDLSVIFWICTFLALILSKASSSPTLEKRHGS